MLGLLAVDREQRAHLSGDAIVGRDDRLVAIGNIRGHVHIELEFARRDVQSGKSDISLDSADRDHWCGRQSPGLRDRSADHLRRCRSEPVAVDHNGFPGLGRRRQAGIERRWTDVGAVQMRCDNVRSIENEKGGRERLRLRDKRRARYSVVGHDDVHRPSDGIGCGERVDLRRTDVKHVGILAVDGDADVVKLHRHLLIHEILGLPGP